MTATLLPSSVYIGGASGNLSVTVYIPVTNTNNAGAFEGVGVVGSLTSSTNPYSAVLQFNLATTTTGALTLRAIAVTSSTNGVAKFTVNDGVTAIGANIGATSLSAESQSSVTSTGADLLYQTNVVLTSAPSSSGILTCRVDFNSTGAWTMSTSVWQFSLTQ